MAPRRVWLLSILPFGAVLQVASAQTLVVDPSGIPGITVSGPETGRYAPGINALLGSVRNQETNAWLPFGFVASNNTAQPIVAFAARWLVTDSSGRQTERIMTRSLMQGPKLFVAAGESVLLLPFWLLASNHRGIPGLVSSATTGSEPSELTVFQNAQSIRATLDAVVFASGQFVGPNVGNELACFQAAGAAPYNLATSILAKRDAGVATEAIVNWLRQTAATQAAGSLQSRDWNTAVTAREAGAYMRAYSSGGESGMFALAQERMQGPHFAVHQ